MHLYRQRIVILWLLVATSAIVIAQEQQPADKRGETQGQHEKNAIRLSAAEWKAAEIVTAKVGKRAVAEEISAPGEVYINAYRSAQVTPRIGAQIVKRRVYLGQKAKQGQALVTLSSVEMASAQGEVIVATREWQRVKELGSDLVSAKRYVRAQVAQQQAYAKVITYGMTPAQAEALLEQGDASKATGEFDLLAPRDGIVISDDFVVGQMVSPGTVLFEITDKTSLWVVAHLSPDDSTRITIGSPARVSTDEKEWFTGRIIQKYHRLDETTRTYPVRIAINNRNSRLEPGQFVTVVLKTSAGQPVLMVPRHAVMLVAGAQTVFRRSSQGFHAQPVTIGATRGRWIEIKDGLKAGDEIAVDSVYFLKSMMLKSQLGESD